MAHDWTSFSTSIGVKAEMATIYDAWTKSQEIQKWFLKTCQYFHPDGNALDGNQNVHDGCIYEWTWYLYDEIEKGQIIEANGQDLFQFIFAGVCTVEVKLKKIDDHTLVTLTQHAIPTDEASKFNIRIGCLQGWTFYLANLKSFYETGYDLRNKIPELKGINN